jgi:FkbM family methyltransferase
MYNELIIKHGRTPGVFLDIGCSEGCFLERMAERATTVHAFEPLPTNAATLRNTIQRIANKTGRGSNIVLHEVALWHCDERKKLFINGLNSSTIAESWRKQDDHAGYFPDQYVEVDAITLDSLNLTGVTVCKIDVERAELEVLQGGAETFTNNKMLISLETHRGIDCRAIVSLLHSYGYTIWSQAGNVVGQIEVDKQYCCSNDADLHPPFAE